jgi:hypothetical protein
MQYRSTHKDGYNKNKTNHLSAGRGGSCTHTLLGLMGNGAAVMETACQLIKKLNTQLPDHLAILFLGVFPKEFKTSLQAWM